MENLYIVNTESTPLVDFNSETGILTLEGKSVPTEAEVFYKPVIDWLEQYIEHPNSITKINLKLEYFNIASSKRILFILYKLNDLIEKELQVNVDWLYHKEEDDMLEVGQDFESMVKIPFDFIEYNSFASV